MKIIYAIIVLIAGCTKDAEVMPTCLDIEVIERTSDKIRLKIHSHEPSVFIEWEDGRSITIQSTFYNCTRLALSTNETLTVNHKCIIR